MNHLLIIFFLISCASIFMITGQEDNVSSNEDCLCAQIYKPVCGSDGVTYGNICELHCEKAIGNSDVKKVKNGRCSNSNKPPCRWPLTYNPVCGSDGVTYDNKWKLDCARVKSFYLRKVRNGPCLTTIATSGQSAVAE